MFRYRGPTVRPRHIYRCLTRTLYGVKLHEFKNWWCVINVFGCSNLVRTHWGYKVSRFTLLFLALTKVFLRAGWRYYKADLWLFLPVFNTHVDLYYIMLNKTEDRKIRLHCFWFGFFAVAPIQMYFIRIDCLSGVINWNVYALNE